MDSLNPHREHNLPLSGSTHFLLLLLSVSALSFSLYFPLPLLPFFPLPEKLSHKHPWPWLANTAAAHNIRHTTESGRRERPVSFLPSCPCSFLTTDLFFSVAAFSSFAQLCSDFNFALAFQHMEIANTTDLFYLHGATMLWLFTHPRPPTLYRSHMGPGIVFMSSPKGTECLMQLCNSIPSCLCKCQCWGIRTRSVLSLSLDITKKGKKKTLI